MASVISHQFVIGNIWAVDVTPPFITGSLNGCLPMLIMPKQCDNPAPGWFAIRYRYNRNIGVAAVDPDINWYNKLFPSKTAPKRSTGRNGYVYGFVNITKSLSSIDEVEIELKENNNDKLIEFYKQCVAGYKPKKKKIKKFYWVISEAFMMSPYQMATSQSSGKMSNPFDIKTRFGTKHYEYLKIILLQHINHTTSVYDVNYKTETETPIVKQPRTQHTLNPNKHIDGWDRLLDDMPGYKKVRGRNHNVRKHNIQSNAPRKKRIVY
eukprot:20575_1